MKVLEADGSLVNPARPIVLRDLMTHTSGLTYHFVDESPVGKMYQRSKLLDAKCSLEAAIDDLTQFPLAFQPRSRWRYSVGIDVIARVIEVVSSRPLGAFLRERLFEPLGMVDTAFEVPLEKRNRLAAMYGRPDVIAPGPTVSSEFEAWAKGVNDRLDVSRSYPVDSPDVFVRGGHGLFGTTGDYFRFAQMLANGGHLDGTRILGRKTLALMHANHLPAALLPLDIGGVALARLRLRPRLAGGARRGADRSARFGGRVRLVRGGEDPLLGRSAGGSGRALHDPVDDELRPAGTRSARARLSGDRGLSRVRANALEVFAWSEECAAGSPVQLWRPLRSRNSQCR